MKRLFLFTCCVLVLLAPFPLQAAPPALSDNDLNYLRQQQQQIILQQEERRRHQEEELQKRETRPPGSLDTPFLPHLDQQGPAACMDVNRVIIKNATLIPQAELNSIKEPYEQKCLTLVDINNLLRDVTNAYIKGGYITSRAFVNPNPSEEGMLEILVIEGTVEKIIINDGKAKGQELTAFPGLMGGPLNLRDIEQGLDQLNRLPSNNAVMQIEPGETPGSSVVLVNTQSSKTWRIAGGLDNLGQRSTGHYEYSLSIEKDNLLGLGDQFAAYWTSDAPFLEHSMRNERRNTGRNRSFSGYFSMPAGYWTISGNFGLSHYEVPLLTQFYEFKSSGETEVGQVGTDRVIHRDADGKTTLGVRLTSRSVKNYIEDIKLDVSSYRLNSLTLSATHSRRIWGGALGLGVEYHRGLNILGASPDLEGHAMPKGEFNKIGFYMNWYKPFVLGEQYFTWQSSLQGQCSNDSLYGAEKMQIGGYYTVRGLSDDSLIGDSGGYIRNELAWSMGAVLPDILADTQTVWYLELFAAYDYGFIKKDRNNPYERGEVHGATLGVRTRGDLGAELVVSKAFKAPGFIEERNYECYARLRYAF